MSSIPPPPLVRVTWEDATALDATAGWVDVPEEPLKYKPRIIITVGFLLYQGDEGLIITGSWSPEQTAARDQIPRGMVQSVEFLTAEKRKR